MSECTQKVKFLCEKLTQSVAKWTKGDEEKLQGIKESLMEAPVLSLPDLKSLLLLSVKIKDQVACGVLARNRGRGRGSSPV